MAEAVALAEAFLEVRPESAARSLESLPPADAAALLELVPVRVAAPAAARMTSWAAARCISALSAERAGALMAQLASRDALAILRQMPAMAQEGILNDLPADTARHYRRALTYQPTRVGAWVNHDVATIGQDHTVREALQTIVSRGRPDEAVVYVVDQSRRYLGTVTLAALLHSAPGTTLAALAQRQRSLPDSTSLAAVAGEAAWSTSLALPVTDGQGELLGDLSRASLEKALHQSRGEAPAATGPGVLFHLAETYLGVIGELARVAPPPENEEGGAAADPGTGQ